MENTDKYSNFSLALQNIKNSSGWMKFLAILVMIVSFLLLLGGIFFGKMENLFSNLANQVPGLAAIEAAGSLIAIVLIVIALIYGYMGYVLFASSNAASKIGFGDDDSNLANYASNFSRYLLITVIVGALGIVGSLIGLMA